MIAELTVEGVSKDEVDYFASFLLGHIILFLIGKHTQVYTKQKKLRGWGGKRLYPHGSGSVLLKPETP